MSCCLSTFNTPGVAIEPFPGEGAKVATNNSYPIILDFLSDDVCLACRRGHVKHCKLDGTISQSVFLALSLCFPTSGTFFVTTKPSHVLTDLNHQ